MFLAFPLLLGLPVLIPLRVSGFTGVVIDSPLRICPGSPGTIGRLRRALISTLSLLWGRQLRLGARSAGLCHLSVSQHGVQPACARSHSEPSRHAAGPLQEHLGG